ncbi:hypothetical protein M6B38_402810 [Iris pallida]|uniref:Uncharacterized protein n=1 Tax=Iris pallida TaxID=29817 RepID=A0AAX6FSW7_IRIPA|nr:hypothetical protein M6B38_402810 [Iris pallida]
MKRKLTLGSSKWRPTTGARVPICGTGGDRSPTAAVWWYRLVRWHRSGDMALLTSVRQI